jgi:peptide chain release factor 2
VIAWRISGGRFDVPGKIRRVEQIKAQESDPSLWNNAQKAAQLLKEKKQFELILEPVASIERALDDVKTLIELCKEAGGMDDASLGEIHQHVREAQAGMKALEFQRMLSGERDAGDAYLTVHAGAGGTEACDWASILARMYSRYAAAQGFKCSMIDFTEGDGAGYRSVTFEITGTYAYGYLKAESGIHRLVRISPFDSNARRHTSFASVYVYPIVEDDIEIVVRDEDLRVDTYRAGGAGGQHVNKTDSAVRMTHIPTGIVVQCQAERSQIQNRAKAMKMLKARLYELEMEKRQAAVDKENAAKKQIAWGSQIRNYVLQPYQLVKDVRTGTETSGVDKVLDGDIQEFIESYLMKKTSGELNAPGAVADPD